MVIERTLLIEPHYFGSLEYFVLIKNYVNVTWDVHAHFTKQTFRNRAVILGANGPHNLIVPVIFGNRTAFKDTKVDYSQRWVQDHWGAIHSAYGKAPFFEYFGEEFHSILQAKPRFLIDLCSETMTLCLKLLHFDSKISLSKEYIDVVESPVQDFRGLIHPKKPFNERSIHKPQKYFQNFGKEFVTNLSILDLLFCTGNESSAILEKSSHFRN